MTRLSLTKKRGVQAVFWIASEKPVRNNDAHCFKRICCCSFVVRIPLLEHIGRIFIYSNTKNREISIFVH